MTEVQHVFGSQDLLGEGPLWDPQSQTLYWVDIENQRYHRLQPGSGTHQVTAVGLMASALAQRQPGGLVMATDRGFALWDETAATLTLLGDPEGDKPMARFNDGAADRAGRFWAGTLGDDTRNALYRLDPDGSFRRMESGIGCSNGMGWSPDNHVMYYTDSGPRCIYAYDFDLASGAIANRRIFVDSHEASGVPDGLTVDHEGFIWSARWDGWRIERYDPQGKLERTIPMPVQRPTSVMFGGADLDTLYITSARTELSAADLADQPLAGDLFCLHPGVRGLVEPRFAG